MIVTGQDHAVAAWVAERLPDLNVYGGELNTETYRAIGVTIGGVPAAGVVYFNKTITGIEMAVASDNPRAWTPAFMFSIFSYPFDQLGCQRITVTVRVKNKRSRRLIEGAGFKLEGRLRRWMSDGTDAHVYSYLADEFRESRWSRNVERRQKGAEQQRPELPAG
jgi:hypothetical protein|tara:strand:+ start:262 stop:753 length:492 start_codon:yes stop_codon:yes gene_type:complete